MMTPAPVVGGGVVWGDHASAEPMALSACTTGGRGSMP
jgi:hypothetical protein